MERNKSNKGRKKKVINVEPSEDTEVLVLPPDLLEQLGIQLGHSSKKPETTTVTEVATGTINNNTLPENSLNSPVPNGHTSLSETASLMMNSVLLSPTFTQYSDPVVTNPVVPTLNNGIESETLVNSINQSLNHIEIKKAAKLQRTEKGNGNKVPTDVIKSGPQQSPILANPAKIINNLKTNITLKQNKVQNNVTGIEKYSDHDVSIKMNSSVHQSSPKNSTSPAKGISDIKKNIKSPLNSSNGSEVLKKTYVNYKSQIMKPDISQGGKYGSNKSQDIKTNTASTSNTTLSNCNVIGKKSEKCVLSDDLKVNINFQKPVQSSNIEINNIHSIKATAGVSVAFPMVNDEKAIPHKELRLEKEKEARNLLNQNIRSSYQAICNRKQKDSNNYRNDIPYTSCKGNPKSTEKIENSIISHKAKDEENANFEKNDEVGEQRTSSPDKNVQEIAHYLSKLMKKNHVSNVNNKVIPKSNVHGVEKPGGLLNLNKSGCKTYKKTRKSSAQNLIKNVQLNVDNAFVTTTNIDSEIPIDTVTTQPVFCACYDFGLLSDCEHVHFEIDCNVSDTENNDVNPFICHTVQNYESTLDRVDEIELYEPCDNQVIKEKNHVETVSGSSKDSESNKFTWSKKTTADKNKDKVQVEENSITRPKTLASNIDDTKDNEVVREKELILISNKTISDNLTESSVKRNDTDDSILIQKDKTLPKKATETDQARNIKPVHVKETKKFLSKKRKRSLEVQFINLKNINVAEEMTSTEPWYKKTRTTEAARKRKRNSASTESKQAPPKKLSIKCDDCSEMIDEQVLLKHMEENHRFIGFSLDVQPESIEEPSTCAVDPHINQGAEEKNKDQKELNIATEVVNSVNNQEVGTHLETTKESLSQGQDMELLDVGQDDTKTSEEVLSARISNKTTDKFTSSANTSPNKSNHEPQNTPVSKRVKTYSRKEVNTTPEIKYTDNSKLNSKFTSASEYVKMNPRKKSITMIQLTNESLICINSSKPDRKPSSFLEQPTHENYNGMKTSASPKGNESDTCGVCSKEVANSKWMQHIYSEHNYLAWKNDEERPLDLNSDGSMQQHLYNIMKEIGLLTCSKCGLKRKYPKCFLDHVKSCTGNKVEKSTNKIIDESIKSDQIRDSAKESFGKESSAEVNISKCGVCKAEVDSSNWISHIFKEHQYIAWKDGDTPLNADDEEILRLHLHTISKQNNGLKCSKCGKTIKYAKSYMEHIKSCMDTSNISENDTAILEQSSLCNDSQDTILYGQKSYPEEIVCKCGVCGAEVDTEKWISHIFKEHQYIAWKDGDEPLNVEDEKETLSHLQGICKQNKGLECSKCERKIKSPKRYMKHVRSCAITDDLSGDDDILLSQVKRTRDSNQTSKESTSRGSRRLSKEVETNTDHQEDEMELVTYKCGVCDLEMDSTKWVSHISSKHQYIAWRHCDKPVNVEDEEELRLHLHGISKLNNGLKCWKCRRIIKYAKNYMEHVKTCTETAESSEDENLPLLEMRETRDRNERLNETPLSERTQCSRKIVPGEIVHKCGVCGTEVSSKQWIPHIFTEHRYVAWKDGDKPLNTEDMEEMRLHYREISKLNNGLECSKCGQRIKYAKLYMDHTAVCTGAENEVETLDETTEASPEGTPMICPHCGQAKKYLKSYKKHLKNCDKNKNRELVTFNSFSSELKKYFEIENLNDKDEIQCGVCDAMVTVSEWLNHIEKKHNYLAKKKGTEALDTENQSEVMHHLNVILRGKGELVCVGCGLIRKYTKVFYDHLQICDKRQAAEDSFTETGDAAVCAICKEEINSNEWKQHCMDKHYNIAWILGQPPINFSSQVSVNNRLKEYTEKGNKLECKTCGVIRHSQQGFFAHIIACGKTEEDQEIYKVKCDICQELYICTNKAKHMKVHKDEQILEMSQNDSLNETNKDSCLQEFTPNTGKRRAAQKAIKVIGNLTKNISLYKYKCPKCDFGSDEKHELDSHKCEDNQNDYQSDGDDESVKSAALSDNESPESDVDSNISAEEEVNGGDGTDDDDFDVDEGQPKIKSKLMFRSEDMLFPYGLKRPPFSIKSRSEFIGESARDYIKTFYTDDVLYPEWRECSYEVLEEEEAQNYMPSLQESCKICVEDSTLTLKRFEAVMRPASIIFTGGSIRRISFAPIRQDDLKALCGHFLLVISHMGPEEPRYVHDEVVKTPGLIQIWDLNNFVRTPHLALAIAHDFGTIWDCDWCPSGARDDYQNANSEDKIARLGLLAVACSNGSAYVLSVPYPNTVVKGENKFLKIRPVAELRLAATADRRLYHATAIKWTPQNGHETVAVGYSDGSVAYYNLVTNSPLLSHTANGVNIFYPYHEEFRHKRSITAIDIGAQPASRSDIHIITSTSISGSCISSQTCPGFAARSLVQHPADSALWSKHCPHAMIVGEHAAVNKVPNEIEWWGTFHRRLGIQSCAECFKCGTFLIYSAPILKTLRLYPLTDHRKMKGYLQAIEMVPLGEKRKIKSDELGLVLEPRTYEEVVGKFAVSVKKITKTKNVRESEKAISINRYPLGNVVDLAFCPAPSCHQQFAVALFSGFIMIMKDC